jgi:hypothetical protein
VRRLLRNLRIGLIKIGGSPARVAERSVLQPVDAGCLERYLDKR